MAPPKVCVVSLLAVVELLFVALVVLLAVPVVVLELWPASASRSASS